MLFSMCWLCMQRPMLPRTRMQQQIVQVKHGRAAQVDTVQHMLPDCESNEGPAD